MDIGDVAYIVLDGSDLHVYPMVVDQALPNLSGGDASWMVRNHPQY